MSAFGQLWKRAPLWRTCLLLGTAGMAMAAFFPTPFLKKRFPWLPGTATSLAVKPEAGPDAQNDLSVRVGYPDIRETVQGSLSLAGHTLALPAGEWHPVLNAQAGGPTGPYSFIALIRTSHGAITGLLTAKATQQPIPLGITESLMTPCHDDRNYASHSANTSQKLSCSFLASAALMQETVSLDPFITETVSRVRALGFPLPPLMILDSWRRLTISPPAEPPSGGQTAKAQAPQPFMTQAVAVDLLLAPLAPRTNQLLAPPQDWLPDALPHHAAARDFVARVKRWTPQWEKRLEQGFAVPPVTPSPTPPDPALHA